MYARTGRIFKGGRSGPHCFGCPWKRATMKRLGHGMASAASQLGRHGVKTPMGNRFAPIWSRFLAMASFTIHRLRYVPATTAVEATQRDVSIGSCAGSSPLRGMRGSRSAGADSAALRKEAGASWRKLCNSLDDWARTQIPCMVHSKRGLASSALLGMRLARILFQV